MVRSSAVLVRSTALLDRSTAVRSEAQQFRSGAQQCAGEKHMFVLLGHRTIYHECATNVYKLVIEEREKKKKVSTRSGQKKSQGSVIVSYLILGRTYMFPVNHHLSSIKTIYPIIIINNNHINILYYIMPYRVHS